MLTKTETWALVDRIVREEGYELFDLEYPAAQKGALRVYITHPGESANQGAAKVGVEDCARVSRRILGLETIEELLPGRVVLEVSSPGINRKLRRPEHFAGAIGERVKVILQGGGAHVPPTDPGKKCGVVVGTLLSFDGSRVAIREEASKDLVDVPLGEIREARIDFLFA